MLSASLHPYFSSFERHSSLQLGAWLNPQLCICPCEEVYTPHKLSMRWGGNPLNPIFNMLCGFSNPALWRSMLPSAIASVVPLRFLLQGNSDSVRKRWFCLLMSAGYELSVLLPGFRKGSHDTFALYMVYIGTALLYLINTAICTSCRVQ